MSTSSIRTASIPTRRSRRRWARCDTAVRQGKALYVGISSYSQRADRARRPRILQAARHACLIHQPSYSMFNRWTERDHLLDRLETEGMGCIAFSPLAQGVLTDRYLDGIPADSRAAGGRFLKAASITEKNVARVRALNAIAKRRGQTLAQMALAWVLRDPRMTSALIGASRPEQVRGCGRRVGQPRLHEGGTGRDRPSCSRRWMNYRRRGACSAMSRSIHGVTPEALMKRPPAA